MQTHPTVNTDATHRCSGPYPREARAQMRRDLPPRRPTYSQRRARRIVGRRIAPTRPRIRLVRTRPRGLRTFAQLLERLIHPGSQRRRQAGAHLLRQRGGEPRHEQHMARRVQTSREPIQKPFTALQRPARVGKRDRGRQITTNARRPLMRQRMTLLGLVRAPRFARSVRRKILRKRDAARGRSTEARPPQRL